MLALRQQMSGLISKNARWEFGRKETVIPFSLGLSELGLLARLGSPAVLLLALSKLRMPNMNVLERVAARESVVLNSLDENLAGALFLPASPDPAPSLIVCHGAGDFKENYFELCEFLAGKGIASLAVDMHGHGASEGARFHVNINQWVADVQAAIKFLGGHPHIDPNKIGAFGLSSGGTAILEAAVTEPKLKALVALDATVRNSLPLPMSCFLQFLVFLGKTKKLLTKSDWRLPLAKMGEMHLASDPEINKKVVTNPQFLEAFMSFPLPGAAEAFFVDTIQRIPKITV